MRALRRPERAVSPIIATVLLVAITLAAGVVLFAFRPPLPGAPSSVQYEVVGNLTEPAYGDGSDCTNVNNVQQCLTLPAFGIVFTDHSPADIPLSQLQMAFLCNGTVYLEATLDQIEWIPGTPSTPGAGAPQLGHCGTYTPPNAAFNRFAFFDQLNAGSTILQSGDELIVYAHTFTSFQDDDFHGAPPWCYTVVGACTIDLTYTGTPSQTVDMIPLIGLAT